jgi:YaiO family outer membrane protein
MPEHRLSAPRLPHHPLSHPLPALLIWFCAAAAQAESADTAPPDTLVRQSVRSLDVSSGAQHLTGGFASWRHLTVRGVTETGPHVLQGELSAKREFDTNGNFFGLTDTWSINDDWFTTNSIGAGDGAFYLPRYRYDGLLYRKWLPQKNLVSAFGLGYYRAPDGHIDRSVSVGGAWYFARPVVLEVGLRFNRSSPGDVNTHQQFVALSYNPDPANALAARVAWGSEGYQALTENTSLVNFDSKEASLTWRFRLSPRWGLNAGLNHYRNPTYERSGVDIGLTHQFD